MSKGSSSARKAEICHTVGEVALFLKTSEVRVRTLIQKGLLKAFNANPGGSYKKLRIRQKDFQLFLRQNREERGN